VNIGEAMSIGYWLPGVLLVGATIGALVWAARAQKSVVVRVLSKWTREEYLRSTRTGGRYGKVGYIGTDRGYARLPYSPWYEECEVGKKYLVKAIVVPRFVGRYWASRIPAEAKVSEIPSDQWLSVQALVEESCE
jgi:hypothetical protein